jgi:hypothetical protein
MTSEYHSIKYCVRPRGGGKTTKVLQWAVQKLWNEELFVVVCIDSKEAKRLYNILKPFGATPSNFHSASSVQWSVGLDRAIAIDNLDLIPEVLKNTKAAGRVELVTVTGETV